MKNLERMFNPRTVAIVGASERKGSVGNDLIHNLSEASWKLFLINPHRDSIDGIKAYPSIKDVPEKVDLVIIATPASTVPSIVLDCDKADAGGIVIITAGFKETGDEGMKIWVQLQEAISKTKVPVIGPNCLGFIKPRNGLNASFASKMPSSGRVAFISQSGALGTAMLDWSIENGVGFSYFISIGSMIDVDFNDLIEYLGNDPNTSGIILYMESLADSQRFVNVCKEVVKKKPILTLKVGKTAEGANAAKSHTGSIAGNDAIFDVAFKAAGIVRLTTIEEMLNCFEFLSMHDSPKGENIAILTNAGGPGVVATDMLVSQNGKLAKLSASTIEELNKVLPAFWSHGNPIDVLGDAPPERYKQALDIIVKDANIDSILVIVTPQAMTNPEGVARELVSAYKADKTVVASFIGGHDVSKAKPVLEKGKIPFYETPEEALDCLISLSEYQKKKSINVIPDKPFNFKADKKKAESLIQFAVSEGRKSLSEDEAKKVLSCYGIDSPKVEIAKKKSDISKIVSKLDFPIVMKILSPDILHKTDIGGVVLNINSKKEAEAAFDNILKSVKKKMPAARIDGILVEEMIKRNYELLFGSKKDPLFGRVIVFGMGGTAVELYKDTAIELPPITMQKAKTMIDSTKIGKLMSGYRGMKSADINLIQQLFCQFAKLLEDFPQIKEIDINPLAIAVDKTTKAAVLDAKILLE